VQLLTPETVAPYGAAHFFAGVGGWPLALRMAGWPDDKPVWTASLPCQPFSNAGKRKGTKDERHLWPVFRELVAECRPPVLFGEQVASRDGREWLAGVRTDLEALGYAVGAADLCAAGVGAPHIRQRLFWVATQGLGDAHDQGLARRAGESGNHGQEQQALERAGGDAGRLADADGAGRGAGSEATEAPRYGRPAGAESWSSAYWHLCLDGKHRRVPLEPELFPLAHGLPGRVGQLRAYGNAIVPPLAATFVRAFMDVRP